MTPASAANPAANTAAPTERERQEMARLSARVVRIEDESSRGRAATRSVAWLAGTAAVLGFVATSLTWRLGSKAAVIDGGLRAATALLERSTAGTEAAFQRIDGTLATQGRAVADLAATLAAVEAAGRQAQATLATLERQTTHDAEAAGLQGRQLTELALEFARFRRDTEERLARHHDALLAGRGEVVRVITDSIAGVEEVMLRQAEELRTQRDDMNAAAVQMRTRQQRLLGEATEAIATQLDGLRQIVACLRDEDEQGTATASAVVAGDAAATPAAPPPATAEAAGDEADEREPAAAAAEAVPAGTEVAAEPADTVTE